MVGLVLGMRADGWDSHQELIDRLAEVAAEAEKPVLVVSFMSNSLTRHWRGFARARELPLVEDLERGLKAVRHLIDYAAFRRSAEPTRGEAAPRIEVAELPPRRILTDLLEHGIAKVVRQHSPKTGCGIGQHQSGDDSERGVAAHPIDCEL